MVLQAGAHETGTAKGGHARRAVRVQAPGRQQRGVHRRPVLRADVQRVLQVRFRRTVRPVSFSKLSAFQNANSADENP